MAHENAAFRSARAALAAVGAPGLVAIAATLLGLLPQVTPIAACVGFALGRLEELAERRGTARGIAVLGIGLTLLATGIVGAVLVYERFGS